MKNTIVFAVSCEKYKEERIKSCEETWAKPLREHGVTVYYVIGKHDQDEDFILKDNVLYVKCHDSYNVLPAKTRMVARYFMEHCKDYEYMFKCDDDTYIHVNNFINYELTDGTDYLGVPVQSFYASGGGGYFLSKKSAKIIADSDLDTGAEDLLVGQTLKEHNITFTKDYKFNGWPGGWGKSDKWIDNSWNSGMGDLVPPFEKIKHLVTNHLLRLPPETMYDIHKVVTEGEMALPTPTLTPKKVEEVKLPITEYLENSKIKFAEYIKDKRVVVVGPSEHLIDTEYGKIIDSYDIVIRVNRGLNIDKKYFKDIGYKTDILSSCLYVPSCGTLDVDHWKDRGVKWVINPLPNKFPFERDNVAYYEKFGNLFDFHVGDLQNWVNIERQLKTRPNTGLATIFELLLFEPKEIHVCGFSFYTTKFIPSYTTQHAYDTIFDTIEVCHKQEPQRQFFFDLMENNDNLTVDWYIQKLYDTHRGE